MKLISTTLSILILLFVSTARLFGVSDDYVAEVGLWQSFDANNVLMDDGKFLVLWKKTPKGWKMFRDSFSSNRALGN